MHYIRNSEVLGIKIGQFLFYPSDLQIQKKLIHDDCHLPL